MSYHNGMQFSTSDNDHDADSTRNCAAIYSGGNWWRSCSRQNMNGKYGGKTDSSTKFMVWYYFNYDRIALKSMTLMFQQVV